MGWHTGLGKAWTCDWGLSFVPKSSGTFFQSYRFQAVALSTMSCHMFASTHDFEPPRRGRLSLRRGGETWDLWHTSGSDNCCFDNCGPDNCCSDNCGWRTHGVTHIWPGTRYLDGKLTSSEKDFMEFYLRLTFENPDAHFWRAGFHRYDCLERWLMPVIRQWCDTVDEWHWTCEVESNS